MKKYIGLSIFILAIIGFQMFTYTVREDEVAIVKRLGSIEKVICNENDYDVVKRNLEKKERLDAISISTRKGLRFKLPFVDKVSKYTAKYLTYQSNGVEVNTRDSRQLLIQMYAQYRIADPYQFAVTLKLKSNANTKMDDLVYPTIVNAANALNFNQFFEKESIDAMLTEKKEELNSTLEEQFGIYVVDMGINRKNFPEQNRLSIEQKMSKQIEKESEKLVAEGDAEYQKRKAATDRQKEEIIAAAVEEAAKIKADADARALEIFSSVNKDLEFYKFIKRMELYKELEDTTIFFDSDNDFIRQIQSPAK